MSAKNPISEKFQLPKRHQRSSLPSLWDEYSQLAEQYQPLNLGQGFPDYAVPKYITDALENAASGSNHMVNQYTRAFGHPRLVQVLSKLYTKLVGHAIDPLNEILITSSPMTEIIQSHVDNGDEVIIIEPFTDDYEPTVKLVGGILRFIPLRLRSTVSNGVISAGDWVLDDIELEGLFKNRTTAIILNTPNTLGKVFTRTELTKIADLCKKYDVLCISDEGYEWITYDDNVHVRICTLPGMWERTITIGSAGKTFSVTGWNTNWLYGPVHLLSNVQTIHQTSYPAPTQEAIAVAFETEMKRMDTEQCYFNSLRNELRAKRDYMTEFLIEIGMKVIVPQGGYFLLADWSRLEGKVDLLSESDEPKDYRFTKWMIRHVGLQGIPPSAFYSDAHKGSIENYVRYCFFKKDESLRRAKYILKNWMQK